MTLTPSNFPARVREARKAKGLTQAQLALAADSSQPVIARLEAGDQSNPTLGVFVKIVNALGVSADSLLK